MAVSKDIAKIQAELAEMKADIRWMNRIVVGAASLGFLEKIFTWLKIGS